VAIKVVFQTPGMNYSDTLELVEEGRLDDARRVYLAKGVAQSALAELKCTKHRAGDLFVIVVLDFEEDGRIKVFAKGCCATMTSKAQRRLDAEVNPADAKWRLVRWRSFSLVFGDLD
jgi:hypothetical protein